MSARSGDTTPLPPPLIGSIADRLATLAEPTRIRMIEALREGGEASVQEMADLLGLDRRNAGHHLVVLSRAGILHRRTEGRSALYSVGDWGAVWLIHRAADSVRDATSDELSDATNDG